MTQFSRDAREHRTSVLRSSRHLMLPKEPRGQERSPHHSAMGDVAVAISLATGSGASAAAPPLKKARGGAQLECRTFKGTVGPVTER